MGEGGYPLHLLSQSNRCVPSQIISFWSLMSLDGDVIKSTFPCQYFAAWLVNISKLPLQERESILQCASRLSNCPCIRNSHLNG